MVVLPAFSALAKPDASMLATPELVEPQVLVAVSDRVDPSENVPVAANCCIVPAGILETAGVTDIETRAGGVTVMSVEPETEPTVALIVAVPVATPAANPAALTVATSDAEEAQVLLAVSV